MAASFEHTGGRAVRTSTPPEATLRMLRRAIHFASYNFVHGRRSTRTVGTGTGIIALSTARAGMESVLAVDINPNARCRRARPRLVGRKSLPHRVAGLFELRQS